MLNVAPAVTAVRASVRPVSLARPNRVVRARAASVASVAPAATASPTASLRSLPLAFEPDAEKDDEFIARGPGYAVTLSADAAVVSLLSLLSPLTGDGDARSRRDIRITFEGGNPDARPAAERPLSARTSVFVGDDRSSWRHDVPTYERVRYRGVYPGIDLVYYGKQGEIEFDFEVAPHADRSAIVMSIGDADRLELDATGDLVLTAGSGELRQRAPVAYQDIDGVRVAVEAHYVLEADNRVRVALGEHDPAYPLVIDPVLSYAGYLGGSGVDEGQAVAVDLGGNTYVAGSTASANFPRKGPAPRGPAGNLDVFVMKFAANGVLQYSTYVGGSSLDEATGIAVDASGNAYVVGTTGSSDFPAVGAVQATNGGGFDAFALKLDPAGSELLYSTYLGGRGLDEASAVAVSASGVAVIVGQTLSTNFPTVTPRQPANAGGLDAFVTKLERFGTPILFSTYHGGTGTDRASDVALDAIDAVYVVGATRSTDFPVAGGFRPNNAGETDGYITRFGATGSTLDYSFYLGGAARDAARAVRVNDAREAFLVGSTLSANFPVALPALQATNRGGYDAFLVRVRADGGALLLSTYLGGTKHDRGRGIALDRAGELFITGETMSADFPPGCTTACTQVGFPLASPMQATLSGTRDLFVAKMPVSGGALTYSTYFGTPDVERSGGIGIDSAGIAYVAGSVSRVTATPGGTADLLVVALAPNASQITDTDGDSMPDDWERQFGLDPATPSDQGGDPDNDGVSNRDEYLRGTHPRGFYTRYLSEGAATAFFDVSIALANVSTSRATALLRFLLPSGSSVGHIVSVDGQRRATVNPETITGVGGTSFSTVVESDVPVVVDRTMTWDARGYGSHAETSLEGPSTTWYLAEGATHSGFDLYYLIQNPSLTNATVRVTYLLGGGKAPVVKDYPVPASSRQTIWVNEEGRQGLAALAAEDISSVITSDVPIIVERAMYLNQPGLLYGAGHDSSGVTAPATSWFLAEGATGNYFDMYILIANPNPIDAIVDAQFLLPNGTTVTKRYTVQKNSRFNIWVDDQDKGNVPDRLRDTAVSTTLTSVNGVGIIVERSMWWPGPTAATWQEAHNSFGATATGTKWALAEGELGGSRGIATYVLVANTSSYPGSARVTLLYEDGVSQVATYELPANSRTNVDVAQPGRFTPSPAGRRFGVVVESVAATGQVAPAQIVVERAMYSDANGVIWAAGTNALATRIPGDVTVVFGPDDVARPNDLLVAAGSRVRFINLGTVDHNIDSDPHPEHTDCPEINIGTLKPGESRETGNLVIVRTCGFHDHEQPNVETLKGKIVIR